MKIAITDTLSGETRSYTESGAWDDTSEFMWSDGNYACDCNRALFFARSAGEADPDAECGDTRFIVKIASDDGAVLYDETER